VRGELVSYADSCAVSDQLDVCPGGEIVDEREAAAAVAGEELGATRCRVRGEGVFGSVGEGFVYRKGEVVGGVISDEGLDPLTKGPTQSGGVMCSRRCCHVQRR